VKTLLKYGKSNIEVEIPDSKFAGIYLPKEKKGLDGVYTSVREAINKPLKSKILSEIVSVGDKVSIIVDDATRPIPTSQILHPLIKELNKCEVNDSDITVIISNGTHRKSTESERNQILEDLKDRIKIIDHNADDWENLVYIGTTSFDNKVFVNKTAYELDIRIIVCDVDFHQFCGYGGGAKSILPGISDKNSTEKNHSMMTHALASTGIIEGNPTRKEIDEVGKLFRIDFQIAVILNGEKEIVDVFAGDMNETFMKGVDVCDQMYKVSVPERVDAVLVSCGGYPFDIDLYQTQKSIENAIKIVKNRGKVITFAECKNGYGSDLFTNWMRNVHSVDEIFEKIGEKFTIGGHKAFLFARQIKWADIFLYSELDRENVEDLFLNPIKSIEEIKSLLSNAENVAVLPQGNLTLPVLNQ
jgi:nickel-dependent lactate racemase